MSITGNMCRLAYACVVLVLMLGGVWQRCEGHGTFGFDIHHRFSDAVKAMINIDSELPEVGTVDYYSKMVHRDLFFHGRRLAEDRLDDSQTPLTFVDGNTTLRIDSLGFLYYANVSVGTPESWYLVALDTGSPLFWLPCDCAPNCVQGVQLSPTEAMQFNIYSLSASSSGTQLSCTGPSCQNVTGCSCPYSISYLSANTSSSGYLVEDVLHLTTDADSSNLTQARITFGCGVTQTGGFLKSAAPNGLLGLTMDDISLPSILASQGLTANAFSMCFSRDGIGKISFGDRGSSDQLETSLNVDRVNLYNVSITQVTVGNNFSAADFTVIIDSGSSFTLLSEPAYSLLSEKFDSQIKDKRQKADADNPFKFCYETNSSPSDLIVPSINLTMKGGHQFSVIHPSVGVAFGLNRHIYCLGVVKSEEDINIIGENFMTGYRVVFDHERKVLGWKASDCDEAVPPSRSPTPTTYNPKRSGAPSAFEHSCFLTAMLIAQFLSLHLIIL